MKIEIKVKGMMCKGCTSRVEKKLSELGCEQVSADYTTGIVALELNSVSIDAAKSAIEKLGFEVLA